MSHSYPTWNDVSACIYSSGKSFGARDTSQTVVRVGTSASNSEVLVTHVTTRRVEGEFTVFRFGVDIGNGLQVLKTKWMNTKTHEWFDEEPKEVHVPKREYQPKTGAKCTCRHGVERDNCATCEGTGMVIDFARIRNS